eukprot:EG_transcript_16929
MDGVHVTRRCGTCGAQKAKSSFVLKEWTCDPCAGGEAAPEATAAASPASPQMSAETPPKGSPEPTTPTPAPTAPQATRGAWAAKARGASSFFTRSPRFERLCRYTFDEFDLDASGTLDTTEVYAAVLRLYTRILPWVTTAVPPSHRQVKAMVQEIDVDESGRLDFEEFQLLVTLICRRLGSRLLIEAAFLYAIGPAFSMAVIRLLNEHVDCPAFIPPHLRSSLLGVRDVLVVSVFLTLVVPLVLRLTAPAEKPKAD